MRTKVLRVLIKTCSRYVSVHIRGLLSSKHQAEYLRVDLMRLLAQMIRFSRMIKSCLGNQQFPEIMSRSEMLKNRKKKRVKKPTKIVLQLKIKNRFQSAISLKNQN